MSLKVLGLYFSAILLLQCIQARSLTDSTSNKTQDPAEVSTICLDVPTVNFFLVFVDSQFNSILNKTLKSGAKLVSDVITDVSRSNQSHDMQAKIDKLSNFLSDLENSKNFTQKMDNMDALMVILNEYNSTGVEQPTAEDLQIEASLKKNGQQALDDEFENNFKKFMSDFHKELTEYWITLSTDEQDKNTTFNNWYKDFKHLDNESEDKQSELMREFIDMQQ